MITSQHISQALTPAQEGQQMLIGVLIVFLVVAVALVIGHLVTAGPEREMDAAVQRHVDELNSRYARLFQADQSAPTPDLPSDKKKK